MLCPNLNISQISQCDRNQYILGVHSKNVIFLVPQQPGYILNPTFEKPLADNNNAKKISKTQYFQYHIKAI